MTLKANHAGFTLAETVLGLFVLVLSVWLLQFQLTQFKRITTYFNDDTTLNFHVANCQLGDFLADSYFVSRSDQQVTFYRMKEKKIYQLEQYQDMLRVRGATKGHMPLLQSVANVKMSYQQPILTVKITLRNRQTFISKQYLPKGSPTVE
ncbi:ComGF family competence protein [Loigolactobacillus backii]|uniref:Uncharacterized protein n=1 Tax=Loigolactobacillus backii TaxID=375175 RepID=A0A192H5K2_9LACO|nr:ComGF family competence protein [Loigolactobacillus backii]ANK59930.1 hypothetical protein AYR52_06435 [Loigolactobacillus backii]ANK63266.1 hypothetical protein AYR53_11100 [Loigolactobacillus backii]ANK64864.1 hypothetical protein AYR54_06115 [Loigolactobacillus backii]ANK66689.1 hypothetical protein AYR55_02640 [Loigolactobacillus backii]ANK69728.1 hypothetical protein AYR56_05905 [Loigolactobacillus backii]